MEKKLKAQDDLRKQDEENFEKYKEHQEEIQNENKAKQNELEMSVLSIE